MKKIILWMLVFTGFIYAVRGLQKHSDQERLNKKLKIQHTIDSLQSVIDSLSNVIDTSYKFDYLPDCPTEWGDEDTLNLLSAIIFVESCNNDSAYRASEDAVGCLQIRKTMVNDVNRILKRQKSTLRFTYNDRWSRNKSIQMFNIYCKHYNLTTAEEIARCWNGGPRGINNPATVRYWEKVKDKINS